eukprot:jgi/Tetstr1/434491/TSEL_023583.t1
MDRTKHQCLQRCGDRCHTAALPDKAAFPALHMALAQPWAKSASRRLHLPISNDRDVLAGRVVHFDAVIPDDSYLKPLEHLHRSQEGQHPLCQHPSGNHPGRERLLLYIARLSRGKGQEQFLEAASPSALRGFTVAFYAGKRDPEAMAVAERLEEIATRRNISIEVHLDRVDRGELQRRACGASGMVLFPRKDRNPRVLYEGLYHGLPLFLTESTRAPRVLTKHRFAFVAPYFDPANPRPSQEAAPAQFSRQLAKFMAVARRPESVLADIQAFVAKELSPGRVYGNMCQRMGLCGKV